MCRGILLAVIPLQIGVALLESNPVRAALLLKMRLS